MSVPFPTIHRDEAMRLINSSGGDLPTLLNRASALTDAHKGDVVTYARKVYISLIHRLNEKYSCCQEKWPLHEHGLCLLTQAEITNLAQLGKKAGCKEALFTIERLSEAEQSLVANRLAELGFDTFVAYLTAMCRLVFEEFQLIPHPHTYGMNSDDLAAVRPYSGSLTITLRLAEGEKERQHSLERMRYAGEQNAPLTIVLPIGRGEASSERVDALYDLATQQTTYMNIQDVVIQNASREIGREALLDIVRASAVARLVLGGGMNLQARSVMTPEAYELCMMAGVNDWGGVIVENPDLPDLDWTEFDALAEQAKNVGLKLEERHPIHGNILTKRPDLIAPQIYEHIQRIENEAEN